jgi:hypothetical protein
MLKKIALATFAVLAIGLPARADSGKTKIDHANQPASGGQVPAAASVQSFTSGQFGSYSVNEVIARNATIQPGGHADFPVHGRLSDASQVSISILAIDQDLSQVRLTPFFAVPGDYFYSAVDEIRGSNFKYYSQGGAQVACYGEYLIVRVYNDSSSPLYITQLNVHAVNK